MAQGNLLCLCQFGRGDTARFDFVDNLQDQLLRRFAFLRIDGGIDPEQTGIARCIGERRNAVS